MTLYDENIDLHIPARPLTKLFFSVLAMVIGSAIVGMFGLMLAIYGDLRELKTDSEAVHSQTIQIRRDMREMQDKILDIRSELRLLESTVHEAHNGA